MNKKIIPGLLCATVCLLVACKDDIDLVVPYPDNITFEDLNIPERFSHVIPDGGFTTHGLHFNTVKSADGQLAGGFCYSNRSDRSFVQSGTAQSLDSIRYSVWSTVPNNTGVYLVCHASGDDAYFTLDTPQTIDYMLVSNTSWDYLAMAYGDTYGTADKPAANPNVPSKPMGVWHTYVPGGVRKFTDGDYFTLLIKGYNNGKETGSVKFDLACRKGHNKDNPDWDYIVRDWTRFNLTSLGDVDKVAFYMDSSDKDASGAMRTPAWFCLDGIQLKHN